MGNKMTDKQKELLDEMVEVSQECGLYDKNIITHSGTLEELKKYRQQELEYIRVQLVCLLPFQTLEKAHRRLNMLIKEIERYQEYDR